MHHSDRLPPPREDETELVRTRHDWDDEEQLSETVIRAIAAVTGASPREVGPLGECVNLDALNRVFDHPPDHRGDPRMAVSFVYRGYSVKIRGDGEVSVYR